MEINGLCDSFSLGTALHLNGKGNFSFGRLSGFSSICFLSYKNAYWEKSGMSQLISVDLIWELSQWKRKEREKLVLNYSAIYISLEINSHAGDPFSAKTWLKNDFSVAGRCRRADVKKKIIKKKGVISKCSGKSGCSVASGLLTDGVFWLLSPLQRGLQLEAGARQLDKAGKESVRLSQDAGAVGMVRLASGPCFVCCRQLCHGHMSILDLWLQASTHPRWLLLSPIRRAGCVGKLIAAQVVLSLSQCTYTQPGLTGDVLSFLWISLALVEAEVNTGVKSERPLGGGSF